ncbi:uncharacterized protein [Temnothorax longispinosus]|uniref:uncharacterized protein isoform X2 n=1 Tax=Temnothorax longispinosus TaxID=300112 RepID=UPI003A9A27A7
MSRKAFGDLGQRRRRQIIREIFRRVDVGDGRQQDMQIERERSLSPQIERERLLSPHQREIYDADTEEEYNYADDDEYNNITSEEEEEQAAATEREEEYENMENEVEEPARNNNDEFYGEDQALYLGAPLTVTHIGTLMGCLSSNPQKLVCGLYT